MPRNICSGPNLYRQFCYSWMWHVGNEKIFVLKCFPMWSPKKVKDIFSFLKRLTLATEKQKSRKLKSAPDFHLISGFWHSNQVRRKIKSTNESNVLFKTFSGRTTGNRRPLAIIGQITGFPEGHFSSKKSHIMGRRHSAGQICLAKGFQHLWRIVLFWWNVVVVVGDKDKVGGGKLDK